MGKRSLFEDLSRMIRNEASSTLELELAEMESVFAVLVLGSLTGLPLPHSQVSLELLPYMEDELEVMMARHGTLDDMLCVLGGRFLG